MNKLWKYEDYIKHLSHKNEIVRRWAFSSLENRFLNRYTDQVAGLIYDDNEYLTCSALRYLSYHQAITHAPAILERFKQTQGIIAGHCAVTLAKMRYAPAIEAMLERLGTNEDSDTYFGIIEYIGSMRTEQCRMALKSALIQMQNTKDAIGLGSTIANLIRHYNTEDINWIMEKCFASGERCNRYDILLKNILSPLGGSAYFRDLTEFGKNEILSNPSKAIDGLVLKNSHIKIDEPLRGNLITLLRRRQYAKFTAAITCDARNITKERYLGNYHSEGVKEFYDQDKTCLYLLEYFSKSSLIWKQNESLNDNNADFISCIISAYFAIKERSAYIKALSPDSGVEELIDALKNSGPGLPVQIQNKIRVCSPIFEIKKILSKDLMTWGDIWIVKLMGMIGSKEFVPDLVRVFRDTDSLDYIYDDALNSINKLDESADEIMFSAIRKGKLCDWTSFAMLEHLPYAEAYDLALNMWESPSEERMDSYEMFSYCLRGIGDRRGIQKLQDIYANADDAGYIGYSLECLGTIYRVDIPELPEIIKRRKKRAETKQDGMK